MTIAPTTGEIHWTPDATQAGTFFVIIQVRDGKGGMALQEYQVTVLPRGVDLAVAGVDTSAVTTDTQTLVIGGTVRISIHNQGSSPLSGSFAALVFEDRNGNGDLYDDSFLSDAVGRHIPAEHVYTAIERASARAVELLGGMAFVKSPDVSYLFAASRALAFHPPSRTSIAPAIEDYLMGKPMRVA